MTRRSLPDILARLKVALFEPAPTLLEVTPFRQIVEVRQDGVSYKFVCSTDKEVRRASRLLVKEPGTIAWLKEAVRADDVLYDIGANIGLYSVFAALRMSAAGVVYSFEPHLANATSLLGNIEANKISDRVTLISAPLAERDGFDRFHYQSLRHATSSAFGPDSDAGAFTPAASEIKFGCRLSTLVATGLIRAPSLVKIDVDGRERDVLAGMQGLLESAQAPREMQIELDRAGAADITSFMQRVGFRIKARHWSRTHLRNIDAGADPDDEFPCNAIFTRS